MKKAFFLVLLSLGFNLNAQSFKKEKFTEPVDLIKVTSIKKRILGIETIENFEAHKDSILVKYNRRTLGDETVSYEFHNSYRQGEKGRHVRFYVYDWESYGELDYNFGLSDGFYAFEFYSKNKIVISFIGKVKNYKIVQKIDTTSSSDYYNDYPEN
jgi:hypothetical protein